MGVTTQVLKMVGGSLSFEDQQLFFKRLHRHLLHQRDWWNFQPEKIWIDVIYKKEDPFIVYLTLPTNVSEQLPHFLRGKDRKRRTKKINLLPCAQEEIRIPPNMAVCELKLSFDNIFALSSHPIELPEHLQLEEDEMARFSFCFIPTKRTAWNVRKKDIYETKMRDGYREYRASIDRIGLIRRMFYLLEQWMQQFLIKREKGMTDVPWLSQDTLRKLNDSHFQAFIRLAAPQRLLPKLARPFEAGSGENRLKIQFLPMKEQQASLKELNKQKISLYSRSDLNPNVLGAREISSIISIRQSLPHMNRQASLSEI